MTALTADRNTKRLAGKFTCYDIAASTKIYAGAIVMLDTSGNAVPATATTGLIGAGVAQNYYDNSAVAAVTTTKPLTVGHGIFCFVNGDSITASSIGDTAYAFDDQTVKKVGTGLSALGRIHDVNSDGVWVEIIPGERQTSTGLLAANNLSDVGTVATARANLSLDTGNSPTFTGLTLTGVLTESNTTDSSSASTGSVILSGGLGVAKKAYFGKSVLSVDPAAGIGYATGAGAAVTQITSRTTGVTCNAICGAITTDTSSLAAGAEAEFTVTNSSVAATDVVLVCLKTESTTGTSLPYVSTVGAGSFKITLTNLHASTADTSASVINFAVIKAVAA